MHSAERDIVWTSNLAYVVGLITTDGNLSPDGRHIDFTSNDRDLIDTLKKCLGLKNKIGRKQSGYTKKLSCLRIQFGNVALYRWLLEIGLMPNKSKRMWAITVPDKFFFDFLRGHLDGDGSIRKYQDPVYPKSTRLYVNFLSASRLHILWIKDKIKELLDVSGFIRTVPRAYSVTFNKYDSIKLLNEMYPSRDVPCLRRKFVIAEKFLT